MSSGKKSSKTKQAFRAEYSSKWPCIVRSKKDAFTARCEICSSDFSIAHGGANDIRAHLRRKKHTSMAESSGSNRDIGQFFRQQTDYTVIRAETLMTNFLIEHNIAFAASDHLSNLFKVMFPDSTIASKFASRRTKTTAIARTLGQETKVEILKKIREVPFSISTDGSSDRGAQEQLYPIVVRYYDPEVKRVLSVMLEIATTKERSTGRNIFQLLDNVITENKIPWKNVICFTADNAAVMMGEQNGVCAFVKKKNPDIFIMGCPCHLLHLAAEKGASQLTFSPADLLVPVYYYLEKSSKRNKEFREVQILCNVEQHAILKSVCTRWLSLEKALSRLIEQWEPLKQYFSIEAKSMGKKRTLDDGTPKESKKLKVSTSGICATPQAKRSSVIPFFHQKSSAGQTSLSKMPLPSSSQTASSKGQASSKKKSLPSSSQTASSKGQASSKKKSLPSPSQTASSDGQGPPKRKSLPSSSHIPVARSDGQGPSKKKSLPSSSHSVSSDRQASKKKSADLSPSASVNKAGNILAGLNDYNKLYCLFLLKTVPLFNKLNLELQEEAPKIHILHERLQTFLKEIMLHFVKPSVIASAPSLEQCIYREKSNQRLDEDLILGTNVRNFITSKAFSSKKKEEFFTSVRKYFICVCDYVLKKFPLKNELLQNAGVADPTKRMNFKFSSVLYFVKKFHFMEERVDELELEFAHYQTDELEGISLDQRADELWVAISQLRDKSSCKEKYVYLPRIMFAILSVGHSNAEDERIFSLVRKNSTEFRPSLCTQTLSDFLTQKVYTSAIKDSCYQVKFSEKLLEKCKKATTAYNAGL